MKTKEISGKLLDVQLACHDEASEASHSGRHVQAAFWEVAIQHLAHASVAIGQAGAPTVADRLAENTRRAFDAILGDTA